MIYKCLIAVILTFSLSNVSLKSQDLNTKIDQKLQQQIFLLDTLMQNNNPEIINVLMPEVSFGHSNGWIQNFNDFKKDIETKKVSYQEVKQTNLKEIKNYRNMASVRRVIHVKGLYKTFQFEMDLSLLEVWIKKKGVWKLWSRQSIELKP